jgi:hypothetical protein
MNGSLKCRLTHRIVLDLLGFAKSASIGMPELDSPAIVLAEDGERNRCAAVR